MLEDKLTKSERIRLEALSQAQHMTSHISTMRPTRDDILKLAEEIEDWLKLANGH